MQYQAGLIVTSFTLSNRRLSALQAFLITADSVVLARIVFLNSSYTLELLTMAARQVIQCMGSFMMFLLLMFHVQ